MTIKIEDDPIPLRVDEDGRIRVGGTRLLLDMVVGAFNSGQTPEEIIDSYDTLSLANAYSVIGYYLRHKPEIDEYLKQQDAEAEEIRKIFDTPEQRAQIAALKERALGRKKQLASKD